MTNESSLALVEQVTANPAMVLTDGKTYSKFYQHMVDEVEAHVSDVTTDKGRKAIAALAYKVTRTKTTVDAAGKALNEEARASINVVDAARRKVRDELDALAEKARKPLTDWEKAEESRIANIKATLAHIEGVGRGFIGPELQPYGLLFHELDEKIVLDVAHFGEFLPDAQRAVANARGLLMAAQAHDEQARKDAEELERLRAESAERQRKDEEAAAAKAKADADARAAEEADARAAIAKQQAEDAAQKERERIEAEVSAKADAAIKAEQEKTAAAQRETERVQREAEEKAAAIEAEAKRKAAVEAEATRKAEAEKAAREADREHRGKLAGEAKAALVALGVEAELARTVVLAIIAGEIPHTIFKF